MLKLKGQLLEICFPFFRVMNDFNRQNLIFLATTLTEVKNKKHNIKTLTGIKEFNTKPNFLGRPWVAINI